MRLAACLALGTALCAAAIVAPAQIQAVAQAPAAAAPFVAPKTSFGQPDLQGYWTNATLTQLTRKPALGDRAVFTEDEVKKMEGDVQTEIDEGNAPTDPNAPADFVQKSTVTRPEFTAAGGAVGGYNRGWLDPGNHVMRVNGEPRTSILTTPNGQPPARKPQPAAATSSAPARPAESAFNNPETRSAGERCIVSFGRNGGPPMFANGFYNNNYQIVQSPDAVMISVEMNHDARIVRLNSKHRTDNVRPYFGDSIGWWEGDTLVVETTNIPRSQQFMGAWENLKVTERFKRVAKDRIYYGFTVEDPGLWEKPWGGEYEFNTFNSPLYEYACHEGNYALHGILMGARVEDGKKAAEAAKAKPVAAKGKVKP